MQDSIKLAGIREIAEALSISNGTVDRALHGRGGVSAKTAARVLKMAEELGYRPNLAARALKLNRRIRIGVQLPKQIASFFDPLRSAIRSAATASRGFQIALDFEEYPRLGHGDVELLTRVLGRPSDQRYDALIVTPGNPARVDALLTSIARSGTAIICVASDAPRSERLASVAVDAYTSGSIAAELLARTLPNGSVATITGDLTTLDHADKLRGFAATLATLAPHLTLLTAVESHDRAEEAYRQTVALLKRRPRPVGLYLSTANSIPVLEAVREHRMAGKIQIVTTDLFNALLPYIESGDVLATLYQRPQTQAKIALETITSYLLEGTLLNPVTRLAPHIILRSNLPLFLDHVTERQISRGVSF
ncbi:LacI family transcriptional regulator [Granulicella aggregans]|uniref:LacI family transcriptional regulator n=1 Tax=Granulicella aggregans TaxID=474949 RepID=A0A7W8E436_9BACT|nr:LacI family DNA-binding transcriptional regulator [Granulicella aggregans]MBB5058096.1 LacI family transcriptional regulator [Granulicella aggregans]